MIDPVKSSDPNPIVLSDLETSSLLYGVLIPVSLLLQKSRRSEDKQRV